VTATDNNGCSDIDSITIIDNPGITNIISITSDYNGSPVSCAQASDASATITSSGGTAPYTYLWSNGNTTSSINGIDTGSYIITVTDDMGCTKIDSLDITYTNSPDINIAITSNYYGNAVSCADAADGSITTTVTNGIPPFTYTWSNGATTATLNDISAGIYNLTVTDANGCETTAFKLVPNAPPLSLNINTTLVNCGSTDGQIYANARDGSGDYEYSIDSVTWQSNQLFSGLAPGMYELYARDINTNCVSDAAMVNLITASSPNIDNTTIINPTMSGNTDGAILVTASGIGLDIQYQIEGMTSWQSSNLFDQLGEGNYNINVRYRDQSCISTIIATLTAGEGIVTMDSTSNVCSPEISNISNLVVYYLPIGEHEILEALQTITPLSCTDRYSVDPIENYIYVGVVESGTIITFDHWEDGFESNYDFSIQSSTEIWGDGDPTNGLPPGFNIDILTAGDKIFLENAVVSTTRQAVIDYDAGDRISSRGDISITRLGWATGSSTLFAGAVEVQELNQWGMNYSIPVGQNTDVNDMFSYTGFSIMAANDNTVIRIDADANGITDNVITLNQGESYLQNGGVNSGGTIESDQPVQVHLITGDNCSRYETRWFTLSPEETWDNGYYMPVSTLNSGSTNTAFNNKPTYVHLYNPNSTAIEVVFRTIDGIQDTITVGSQSTAYQEIPEGTGAHFSSTENFYAIATIDSDAGSNIANDWGFALLPESKLSPQIYLTGFAPGQNPEYTCDMGLTVPIAGYTASATSEETNNVDGYLTNAFDNDLTTAWYSQYSTSVNDHPHELIIDLGGEYNVIGFRHVNALSSVTTQNFASNSLPAFLPNNVRFDTSLTFAITDNFSILDLDVNLSIDHSKISELTIVLESPSGTEVTLFQNDCTTEMDIIATFDDDNGLPFDCANSNNGGPYLSVNNLSAFDAEFTAGIWKLHINDNSGVLGGGSVDAWSMDITHGVSAPGAIEDFEFYVSQDGINWGVPLIRRSWVDSIPLHDERMCAIDARYVRFVSLSDFAGLGVASIGEFEVLSCASSYSENSSPLWITAGHASGWSDTLDINICVDFNGDGGSITDPNGATYDSSYLIPPLGLLKIYDPDGDQTGIRVWVCDGSDGVISGAWGQDPATASAADPAIDLGVGLINSIPYSAQKCVELFNDFGGNDAYDKCDEVTYTIVIKNTGALPLSTGTISIIDTLPAELEYIGGTSRGIVDGISIMVEDDTLNTTIFPFDEGGTAIDTIILPGDSLLVQFEALIAYVDFGTFITNQAYANSGDNSFDPYISIPIQEPVWPLDSIVPADTLVSCEAFEYPDPNIDTLSYLAIHDTILEGECLDAFTFQRIFTFTDNCQQEYIDTLQITVRDTTAPVILIPADTVISMNDLPFVITVPTSDNCDNDIDLTFEDDTIYNACSFVIERVYTAEDNCSNISQETMNITVLYESTTWPVFITASDLVPCNGETVDLVSTIQNTDGLNYNAQWFYRADSTISWNPIFEGGGATYSFRSGQSNRGYYQVRYTSDGSSLDTNCIDHRQDIYIDVLPIPSAGVMDQTICSGDTTDFHGRRLYQSGLYRDTIQNMVGCDSIVQLELVVLPEDGSLIRDTICYGNTHWFGGRLRQGSGSYFDTLTNVLGCDSIVELQLYERPAITYAIDLAICPSDPIQFDGKTIDSTGIYQEIRTSSTGCDSITILNLLVREIPTSTVPITMCFGDSVEINNVFIKSSGLYSESLSDQNGCDSIANYDIQIAEEMSTNSITETLCEGDSMWFDGSYLSQTGEYQEWTQSIAGCDSTTILNLIVEPRVHLTSENLTICEGESTQLNVQGAPSVIWTDTNGLSCETCPNPIIGPMRSTAYIASSPSCNGTMASTEMLVTVLPVANLTLSGDTSILLGESALIRATTNDPDAIITWMDSNRDTICSNCLSTRVQPTQSTYYIAETYNNQGCIDRDSLYITTRDGCIEGELTVPNFVTPNGDGENDVFRIQWDGVKSVDAILIYNRWGELVFTSTEVDKNLWNGTIDGTNVNPGVYVYYVEYYCLNGNLQRRKGNVTVIK